jgi:uncharacterized membrane protein
MDRIVKQGRLIFALAIAALGVENIVCTRSLETVVPVLPWVPAHSWWGYSVGIAFLGLAFGIVADAEGGLSATLLGIVIVVCDLLLRVPLAFATPLDVSIRTTVFEDLALAGAALTLAGILPKGRYLQGQSARDKLILWGRWLFAISSVVFGVDHFLVLDRIASLVPTWIPGAMFWAWFTGAGFIAAGLSLATKWMARPMALLLALMFGLWVLLLHGPRVAMPPRTYDPNEWSSAFIALAMCGACLIMAESVSERAS